MWLYFYGFVILFMAAKTVAMTQKATLKGKIVSTMQNGV